MSAFLSQQFTRLRDRLGSDRSFHEVRLLQSLPPEALLTKFVASFTRLSPERSTLVQWTPEASARTEKILTFLGQRDVGKSAVYLSIESSTEYGLERLVLLASQDPAAIDLVLGELLHFEKPTLSPRVVFTHGRWEAIDIRATRWEDLVLPPDIVTGIRHAVRHFRQGRSFFSRFGLPYRRGLLLVGPPGNGKTAILRALVTEHPEIPFAIFQGADQQADNGTLDEFLDSSSFPEDHVRILVFEDLDQLLTHSSVSLSHLLNRLDGLRDLGGCLVLATTNQPELLDPALIDRPSRFDCVFEVVRPDDTLRRRFLSRRLRLTELPADGLASYVAATEGFSFAQLQEVFVSAGVQAFADGAERPGLPHLERALEFMVAQQARTSRTGAWNRPPPFVGFRPKGKRHAQSG